VGAVVYSQSLPITRGTDAIQRALHGGEEYELLFTAPAQRRIPKKIAEVPVSLIGEIIQEKTMKLATPDGKTVRLKPGGWQHFA
jgi:thiamine-monophosphate kinase